MTPKAILLKTDETGKDIVNLCGDIENLLYTQEDLIKYMAVRDILKVIYEEIKARG